MSIGTHIGTGKPWHFDAGDCKFSTDALSHVGYVHLCKASALGLINTRSVLIMHLPLTWGEAEGEVGALASGNLARCCTAIGNTHAVNCHFSRTCKPDAIDSK